MATYIKQPAVEIIYANQSTGTETLKD